MYLNDVTAELVSLDEKTLTYRYTVPDNNTTDIVITGIASADKQTMFNGDKPLYMYTSDGTYKHLIDSDGDMKINAPFCDLSGNSVEVDWQPLSFLGGNIYVDTVPPEYAATNISGSMMTEETVTCEPDEWPEDFDRSQVFAGAGDTLAFSVDFSEELKISDVSEIKATLNVKNADGENVVLSGTKSETVKTSVNTNIGVTRVTFDTLTVTEDMIPEDDGKAIRIKSVETADSADLCDNSFSAKVIGELAVPKQQEWLDTLAPSVKTDIVPNDGVYTPTSESSAYESGETVQGFCSLLLSMSGNMKTEPCRHLQNMRAARMRWATEILHRKADFLNCAMLLQIPMQRCLNTALRYFRLFPETRNGKKESETRI